ncbi:hypothetical protein IAT40_000900 [Kwoniella sp. CBS 6097]
MSEMPDAITVTNPNSPTPIFTLTSANSTYSFHPNEKTLDLLHDHFGPRLPLPSSQDTHPPFPQVHGWGTQYHDSQREFPDLGRGDFREPAIHIRHLTSGAHVTSAFKYHSYQVIEGKQALPGLPSTFGTKETVSTLIITLKDDTARIRAELRYSIFKNHDAVARSVSLTNEGEGEVTVGKCMSWSYDFDARDEKWDWIGLQGEWAEENRLMRRTIGPGTQGFNSLAGYSSHMYNPFIALVPSSAETTSTTTPAYGFSLIWTGSHQFFLEQSSRGFTRLLCGIPSVHLSYSLKPGETFTSPEVVGVYSPTGLQGVSQRFHSLYRNHLIRSDFVDKPRPCLLNNWEATYFDMDAEKLYKVAEEGAKWGVKLFVMDDGWFGRGPTARTSERAGLGDWTPNPDRFPDGLDTFVDKVRSLRVGGIQSDFAKGKTMEFGIWVEPEMVNPVSELYKSHPEWVLSTPGYERTEQRNQLVLNLSLKEVQDFIIDSLTGILNSARITYVKWDNNRAMHELPHPSTATAYIFGLYRVLSTLTERFPNVLWEGCASGGGRFDPGMLAYFPQQWTSDDTDALERLSIQWGTTLVYPASSMGCHVSAVPNHQVQRITPLEFRAHVAMMGGSFGFELDLASLSMDEREKIPYLIDLSERVGPLVINGTMWRLTAWPGATNWPAVLYMSLDGTEGVILAYQIMGVVKQGAPRLKLQGIEEDREYEIKVEGEEAGEVKIAKGGKLMGYGMDSLKWSSDYQSRVIWLKRISTWVCNFGILT